MSTLTKEQVQIAQLWITNTCPQEFLSEGKLQPEYAALLEEYIDRIHGGDVTPETLDAGIRYIRLKQQLPEYQPAPGPEPDPVDVRAQHVAKRWLTERCPRHLLNDKGTVGPVYAQLIATYLRDHYQDVWTQENLDKSVKYLQLRGELKEADRTAQDTTDQTVNEKLAAVGVRSETGRINHARRQEEKPQQDTLFAMFSKEKITQPYVKPQEAKLRRIPDNATPVQLKRYSAPEIRAYLERKKFKQ